MTRQKNRASKMALFLLMGERICTENGGRNFVIFAALHKHSEQLPRGIN